MSALCRYIGLVIELHRSYRINICCVRAVPVTFGDFLKELEDVVVVINETFRLEFITSVKPPDLIHMLTNATTVKLVASGVPTAEARADENCQYFIDHRNGYNTTVLYSGALPQHAGEYIGTDNDHVDTAQKTTAHVVVIGRRDFIHVKRSNRS